MKQTCLDLLNFKLFCKYYPNYVFDGFIDFQKIMILWLLLYRWENECPSSARIIAQIIQLTQSTLR